MIGPAARKPKRVGVGAPEEERLHVHVLNRELTSIDAIANPLVRGVVATGMANAADQPSLPLRGEHRLRVGPGVGGRDLHFDMLARLHALNCLGGMHRGGRGQDHCIDLGQRQRRIKVGEHPFDAEHLRGFVGEISDGFDDRDNLCVVDLTQRCQMLAAKRTRACNYHCDHVRLPSNQTRERPTLGRVEHQIE